MADGLCRNILVPGWPLLGIKNWSLVSLVCATLPSLVEMDHTKDLITIPELFLYYLCFREATHELVSVCSFILIKDVRSENISKCYLYVGKLYLQV